MTNDKEVHETLEQIKKLVSYYLPQFYDQENIACNIWLECLVKNVTPYPRFVRSRCIDAVRSFKIRKMKEKEGALSKRFYCAPSSTQDDKLYVAKLIELSNLEPTERQVIFYFFYAQHTLEEIAFLLNATQHSIEQIKASALLKLKRAASFLERKESSK